MASMLQIESHDSYKTRRTDSFFDLDGSDIGYQVHRPTCSCLKGLQANWSQSAALPAALRAAAMSMTASKAAELMRRACGSVEGPPRPKEQKDPTFWVSGPRHEGDSGSRGL